MCLRERRTTSILRLLPCRAMVLMPISALQCLVGVVLILVTILALICHLLWLRILCVRGRRGSRLVGLAVHTHQVQVCFSWWFDASFSVLVMFPVSARRWGSPGEAVLFGFCLCCCDYVVSSWASGGSFWKLQDSWFSCDIRWWCLVSIFPPFSMKSVAMKSSSDTRLVWWLSLATSGCKNCLYALSQSSTQAALCCPNKGEGLDLFWVLHGPSQC